MHFGSCELSSLFVKCAFTQSRLVMKLNPHFCNTDFCVSQYYHITRYYFGAYSAETSAITTFCFHS